MPARRCGSRRGDLARHPRAASLRADGSGSGQGPRRGGAGPPVDRSTRRAAATVPFVGRVDEFRRLQTLVDDAVLIGGADWSRSSGILASARPDWLLSSPLAARSPRSTSVVPPTVRWRWRRWSIRSVPATSRSIFPSAPVTAIASCVGWNPSIPVRPPRSRRRSGQCGASSRCWPPAPTRRRGR